MCLYYILIGFSCGVRLSVHVRPWQGHAPARIQRGEHLGDGGAHWSRLSRFLSFSLRTSVALFLLPTLHRWWWEIYYETRSVWPLDGGKSECTIHRRLCVVQIYRYYYWEVYIICGACACVPAACESTRAMTVNGMRFVRGESTCRVAAETRNKKPDARAYLQLDCCFTIVVVVVLRIFALNT